MTRRTARPGLTLTEALVSLFVMALGLLSLLTLFPLGAFQIGQALKDDRCAQTAVQADGFIRSYWQTHVVEGTAERSNVVAAMLNPGTIGPITAVRMVPAGGIITGATSATPIVITSPGHGIPGGPGVQVVISGVGGNTAANGTWLATQIDANTFNLTGSAGVGAPAYTPGTGLWVRADRAAEPSYPLVIDPLGFQARAAIPDEQSWLGRSNATVALATRIVPRRNLAVPVDPLRTCCLADDLSFGENGAPGATIDWQARYNWSAITQCPRLDNPRVGNLTILVFDGRPPLQGATQTELLVTTSTTVTPGVTTSVTITLPAEYDGNTNYVRKGGWIMDGTIDDAVVVPPGTPQRRLANFYRITGVTPGAPGTFTLDLETPIKPQWNGAAAAYTPQLYVFAGLAEVFERPQLRPTSYTLE